MDCKHLSNLNSKSFRILPTDFFCSECKTKNSLWMCLTCGIINCGRYENGHAKKHFESNDQHCVCYDLTNLVAYCYYCDEYVVNDTKNNLLEQLRTKFQALNESPETLEADRKKLKRSDSRRYSTCKIKIAGLRNLGNTCFMNAVLQSLSNIQQFSSFFKQLPELEVKMNGKTDNQFLLVEEIRKVFISLWDGTKSSISPDSLFHVIWKVVPRFRGYQQQDAHEFLRYILDAIHTELIQLNNGYFNNNNVFNSKFNYNKDNSIVTAVFGGILQNEVVCLNCKQDFKKTDPFLDLSLDIPVERKHKSQRLNDNCNENNKYDLFDCLSSFIQLEELADSELYFCPNCKSKQKSTKKLEIRRLPNVLCLHLKRFRWNAHFRTKVDSVVEFPLKSLDMSKYILNNVHETRGSGCGSTLYDLAAVIVHHGSGAGSGHYTAYAMHEGCWHSFNDSSVTPCDEKTVALSRAYILFYVRRELSMNGTF